MVTLRVIDEKFEKVEKAIDRSKNVDAPDGTHRTAEVLEKPSTSAVGLM